MLNIFFSKTYNSVLLTLVLIAMVVSLGAYTNMTLKQADRSDLPMPSITVTGKGEVKAVPDIAQFSFSVLAEGSDAIKAQELSGTAINEIVAYLKESGIAEKDIKTENYSLAPKYKYEPAPCATFGYCPPGDQVVDGFEVSQTITVKVRATDKAGVILAGIGEKGATNISSLDFTIDDPDTLMAEARQLAINDARTQAKKLAADLGVRLGHLLSYSENQPNYPVPFYGKAMLEAVSADASFSGPELPVGENKITSNVSLTFELR